MPTLSDRLMPHLRRAALARESAPLTDGQLLAAFIAERDAAAFECLVRRHGPMVFGVCRRVIGHAHTAEDAFQAVFVVLARKAGAVKPREQLANWLFGVAYRTALKARGLLNRRRAREKQVDAMPDTPAPTADLWSDIQTVLDAELAALPDHLRLPVVLCDLEGRTQRDAATQLKLPPATLANRLASARRRLAARLSARGVTLSGGLFATVLSANVGSAAVTAGACAAATSAGLSAVGAAAGAIPESVQQLSEGVLRMMMLSKLKAVSAVALAGLLLLGGFGAGTLPGAFGQGQPAPAPKPALGPNLSDAEFLKKMCDALRGSPATPAELGYFVMDADANKRKKVVTWLTEAAASAAAIREITVERHEVRLGDTLVDAIEHRIAVTDARFTSVSDADGAKDAAVRVWDFAGSEQPKAGPDREIFFFTDGQPKPAEPQPGVPFRITLKSDNVPGTSDADFLNKATAEARGSAPTKIEREYFLADKDPKKREKLLDLMLSDPAVAKKVGPDWKKNMLNPPMTFVVRLTQAGPDWSKLIGELLAAKKGDEQILEALTLATTGRLPTDAEKKLVAGMVAKEKDKAAAWAGIAGTLSGTDESKKHAEKLKPKTDTLFLHGGEMKWQVQPPVAPPAPKPPEPNK